MKHIRETMQPKDKAKMNNLNAENEKLRSLVDYVAMMTDVELPEEVENEQEI